MPAPAPRPARPDHRLQRLARRLGAPAPLAWTPPPLPDLIERIDAALADRRASAGGQ